MKTFIPAFLLVMLGAVATLVADRLARVRRADGERGDYWARAVLRLCLLLGPLLVVSGLLESLFPQLWQTGWHLYLDLTTAFKLTEAQRYWIALALPFVVWLLLLFLGLIEKPGGREVGRWLAGAVGFANSRLWILICAVPLVVILALAAPQLGGGIHAYPGAAWATMVLLTLCLIGVALSAGHEAGEAAVAGAAAGQVPAPPPEAWPQALTRSGIELRSIASWPAGKAARRPRGDGARDLGQRLANRGARDLAPELLEAIDGLLHPRGKAGEHGLTRLVLAPDACGQAECTALAAELLEQRFHATALVVTAADADGLRDRLERWLAPGRRVAAVGAEGEVARDALIWVVDAETLSDRLLPMLQDRLLVNRIGLVVWWHLEDYTGVLAANLWAISRRLHRLIAANGRHDVRTLAWMRSAPHGSAQPADFVGRLLPHPFPSETEVQVEQRFPRNVRLHLLESHRKHFAGGDGGNIPEGYRYPPLVAARASIAAGWPTCLEVPSDVPEVESAAFLALPAGESVLAEQLRPSSPEAGARLRKVQASEVLSLVEMVSQGGRSTAAGLPHHVGVTLPENPYVRHLVTSLAGGERRGAGFDSSRRLVCAEAHPAIIRRHLLLALHELPDTRTALLKDFLWSEEIIRQTLDRISDEGKLSHKEVRFLGDGDRLVIDREYQSKQLPAGQRRPLDTVGTELIVVRDPGGAHERKGVRMRLDPERLTIQAYPHRIFLDRGRRYRVREWDSVDEVVARGWLECRLDSVHSMTWRLRNAFIFGIEPLGAAAGIGRRGKLLSRLTVDLHYEEEIIGAIRIEPDLTTGTLPRPETIRLGRPITQSFATRALVLRLPEAADAIALTSLAQALRHVLPVHLGVEEDALEVVALTGDDVDGVATWGVAIVDLYPGGIGLIDAIRDDSSLILQLFDRTHRWLRACPCQSDPGCDECLRSPAALAANSDQPPMRAQALAVLGQIV